jgi:Nif-specific regulatory protein
VRLDPYARASLQVRPWPGNVRELENVLQRAVVIAAGERSPTVQLRHLDGPAAAPPVGGVTFADGTRAYQRALLAETLASTDGNVSEAARRLGLTRSHTYNLLHAFGLSR